MALPGIWFPSFAGSWSTPNTRCRSPRISFPTRLITTNAPATKAAGYAGQLAENVLGLWMQPLDQQKRPIINDSKSQPFPTGQFDSTKGYTVSFTNSPAATFASALPASLEVALVAVDARTAKRLSGYGKARSPHRKHVE